MKQNLTFIVLRCTPVNDRATIINAFSREVGRVAFVIPAGVSREASRNRAILQPLSVSEGIATSQHGSELMRLSQCRPHIPMHAIYSHPVKNALALFLADALSAILREQSPDENLFDFIVLAIEHLCMSSSREAANFHICFLIHLSRLAGIEPDWRSYSPGHVFDIDEGRFRAFGGIDHRILDPSEAIVAYRLSRMTFTNLGCFRFSRSERNRILDVILIYMSAHYASLASLRSLEILRSLF